jgi:hypothetical protein
VVILIDWWIAELRKLGARNVDPYERKLRSFDQDEQKVFEFIAEARAAIFFLRNGISVTMQDKPDLRLERDTEIIYAEVKHQNEKETDRRDEAALAAASPYEFVQVGNVFDDEQQYGWQGMCATAIKKQPQYVEGAENILVFVNHSNSIDLHLRSAVNEFDDAVRKAGAASPLRKLGGMMMFVESYGPTNGWSNVEFIRTTYALQPISSRFAMMMCEGQLA